MKLAQKMFSHFLGVFQTAMIFSRPVDVQPEIPIGDTFPPTGFGSRLAVLDQMADPDKPPRVEKKRPTGGDARFIRAHNLKFQYRTLIFSLGGHIKC